MNSTLKVWTGLGLATALVGVGLGGCAGENGESGEANETAVEGEAGEGEAGEGEGGTGPGEGGEGGEGEADSGEAGEGEGGESSEGGESGENGVAIGSAGSDAVIYGSALAIVEAHALAARDAYAIGKKDAAAEMFAHPVSEVLADMAPVFASLGVKDFSTQMSAASGAALKADNAKGVETAFAAISSALKDAGAKAPKSELSAGAVAAGVTADQIGRAASMYGEAAGKTAYESYLDGYGYYKAAAASFTRNSAAIETYNSGLHSDIKAALVLLGTAYPGAERPKAMDVAQGKLLAASSKVNLGLPSA